MELDTLIKAANIVAAFSVPLILWQTWLIRKQVFADHERSRRELTRHTIREWDRMVAPESSAADKLVAQLSLEQCRDIVAINPLKISDNFQPLAMVCLGDTKRIWGSGLREGDGFIELDQKSVTRLHFFVTGYLNALEIV
jgi:hypothetical protein